MKVLIAIDSSPASQRVLEEVAARPWPPNTLFCIATAVEVGRLAELPALIEDAKRECEQMVKTGAALLLRAKRCATTQSRKRSTLHRSAVCGKAGKLGSYRAYTAALSCRRRITSTEHLPWSATDSETLPITIRSNPLRPCEPSTMTSAFHFSASSKIT
jgi:hypothetical protein